MKNENIFKCYCESRKAQAFYTNCLDKTYSESEKELLYQLVKQATESSNKIRKYYSTD